MAVRGSVVTREFPTAFACWFPWWSVWPSAFADDTCVAPVVFSPPGHTRLAWVINVLQFVDAHGCSFGIATRMCLSHFPLLYAKRGALNGFLSLGEGPQKVDCLPQFEDTLNYSFSFIPGPQLSCTVLLAVTYVLKVLFRRVFAHTSPERFN